MFELMLGNEKIFKDTDYQPDIKVSTKKLPGDVAASIVVVPGQSRYIGRYWEPAFKAIEGRKHILIINVVCVGHHGMDLDSLLETGYSKEQIGEPSEFFKNYLQDLNLQQELIQLKPVLNAIKKFKHGCSLITLITKEDLWQGNSINNSYYREAYLTEINKAKSELELGGSTIDHHFVCGSIVLANLTTRDKNTILKKTVSGYDLNKRDKSVKRLSKFLAKELER